MFYLNSSLDYFCLHLCYEAENSAYGRVHADNEEAFKLTRQLTAAHLASNSSIVKRSSLLVSPRLISISATLTHTHTRYTWQERCVFPNQTRSRPRTSCDKCLWKKSDVNRDGIFKLLWSSGIDSKESIPPAYVPWRAGTKNLFLLRS